MALLKCVTVSKGCDFRNVREDAASVDPEGHRAKCSERVKKTRDFANSEEFGKMLIMTYVASRARIFVIVLSLLFDLCQVVPNSVGAISSIPRWRFMRATESVARRS